MIDYLQALIYMFLYLKKDYFYSMEKSSSSIHLYNVTAYTCNSVNNGNIQFILKKTLYVSTFSSFLLVAVNMKYWKINDLTSKVLWSLQSSNFSKLYRITLIGINSLTINNNNIPIKFRFSFFLHGKILGTHPGRNFLSPATAKAFE